MKLKLKENADINIVTGISDIIIDSINKKWDNIRDFNSIIVNLNEEGFEELVPVIESILEDENKNVGKLQQLVELISPTAKSIDDGKQEAIDELDNVEEIKVEEMKLDENFSNVPEKTTTTVDPVFGKAIEDKNEDEKIIEDALKENEKLAKETIPKEGDTGKKVTSSALKSMHLSESLFDEDLEQEEQWDFNSDVYHALEKVGFKWRNKHVTPDEWRYALEWFDLHFIEDGEWELSEALSENKKKQLLNDLYSLISKKEKDNNFKISDTDKDKFIEDTLKTLLTLHNYEEKNGSRLSSKDMLDLSNKLFNHSFTTSGKRFVHESIKYDIAKEQIKKFKEGKMPKDWSVDDYIKNLVDKKHLTKEEGNSLLSEDVNDDFTSIEEFRSKIKVFLSDLKEAYYLLNEYNEDSFDTSASIINTMSYEMNKLSSAMQEYTWSDDE